MRTRRNLPILVVRIEQAHAQAMRHIDCDEARWQEMRRDILVGLRGGEAGGALLRDGREPMIGGDDDVGRGVEAK
jgi:hypothetical protein